MKRNKFILGFGLLCIFACESISNSTNSDIEKNNQNELEMLVRSTNLDTIKIAIDTLDSIIKISDEKDLGKNYYEKGFVLMKAGKLKESNQDLQKAKELGYLPEKCEKLIELNNRLQEIEKKF